MEAGWGSEFVQRFQERENDNAIATILTRDNREFLARKEDVEVLATFPAAWFVNGRVFIPEGEIVRVEIDG